MKKPLSTLLTLGTLATLAFCGSALAQQAGSFSASIGATHIAPSVDSGNLTAPSLPNTKVDVNANTQITGAVNYMVTDNIAVHVPIGFGFKHEVSGAGANAGVGKLITTRALPITLIGQYRFMEANATFRPYLGAGVSYVKFYKETGTGTLTALTNPGGPATGAKFESKFAPTLQIGAIYNINDQWYLDASYAKTFLKTRATLTTGQTIDVTLNPNAYSLQVGYKF
jgi:outer membrane protein